MGDSDSVYTTLDQKRNTKTILFTNISFMLHASRKILLILIKETFLVYVSDLPSLTHHCGCVLSAAA